MGSDDASVDFYKLSGAGNDFIALAEPERDPPAERIAAWCRRGLSLGADGLFVLRRVAAPGAAPRVEMTHYNADGGRAELCFNGARCAARLAFHLGWADRQVEIATEAGVLVARPSASAGSVAIEAPVPAAAARPVALDLPGTGPGLRTEGRGIASRTIEAWHLVVGVPHLVVLVDSPLEELDLTVLGPPLRRHPALGAAGANVDFVAVPRPNELRIRTWERGVEGETLACGSGIVAAALVAIAQDRLTLPAEVRTAGGRPLRLSGRVEGGAPAEWRLEGDARVVASGRLLPESL